MTATNVVRTAAASVLQTGQYIGKPLKLLPNSTLNQKLGIQAGAVPEPSDSISAKYVVIGCGGHDFVTGSDGKRRWKAIRHTFRHTGLYHQLPFVLRREDFDLTPSEREKYRLRRNEVHGGVRYIAYYARVLDLSETVVSLEHRRVESGVVTATAFEPSLEDLNPSPPILVSDEAVTTTGNYIATSAKVDFRMTSEDIAEFQSACRIIFGSDGYATISEMSIVSGVDRAVSGQFSGLNQTYLEAIYAQIASHISTAWVTEFQSDALSITLDIGNVEPVLDTVIP